MEKQEFVQRVLEAEPTLFHMAFSVLHHEQDCADAVQEAVTKAYAQRHTLKNPAYFKTWLVRIVLNECYQLQRKQKHQASLDEQRMQNYRGMETCVKEEYLDLYRAIDALERRDRICVLLFYMEDFTIAQIAEVLQIPEGTVKSRLSRARGQLKGMLR